MTVLPDHADVREHLTLTYREMLKSGGRTQFNTVKEPLYTLISVEGKAALFSYQGLWKSLSEYLTELGHEVTVMDRRVNILGAPDYRQAAIGLRDFQRAWITKALLTGDSGLIGAPTRFGKCLAPETPVLMYDGTVRRADAVGVGDLVMGPDSLPRRVSTCLYGSDAMFRVTPNNGEPFICTGDHYLVMERTNQGSSKSPGKDGSEVIMMVKDYLRQSSTFKRLHKLVRRGVEFCPVPPPVDPYCYGLWLGDGCSDKPGITSNDSEVQQAWSIEAAKHNLRIVHNDAHRTDSPKTLIMRKLHGINTKSIRRCDRSNVWMDVVNASTISGHKRIAHAFSINSTDVRLQTLAGIIDSTLAGIIDSDGYTCNKRCYAVVWKHQALAEDLLFLARSLGFRATLRPKMRSAHAGHSDTCYEVIISGRLDKIPVRLKRKKLTELKHRVDPRRTGFKVESVGIGPYYGFELEGPDRKFLLGDFTVTHNSYGMAAICRAFPKARIVVTAPGVDLCRQLHEFLKGALRGRDVRGVYTGSRNRTQGEVTVCSVDSLDKMDPDDTDILIGDEPHALISDERLPNIATFSRARKYGFGATLKGRFDKKDPLITAAFGPILSNVTYLEGVKMGAISPLKVVMIEIPFSKDTVPGRADRDVVYARLLTLSNRTAALVHTLMHEVIPLDWQTMAFIQNEKQAEFYLQHAMPTTGTIAMAKRLTSKERETMTKGIADGSILRVLASNIYVQGVTFPDLRVVVNLAGGGANTTAIQKPGRLLQTRPNKNYGVLIDFIFKCRDAHEETRTNPPYSGMVGECWARHNAYKEIGYDIVMIDGKTENSRDVVRAIIAGAYKQDTTPE